MLRLEWEKWGESDYSIKTPLPFDANVWLRTDGWVYLVGGYRKTIKQDSKKTLLEAQQAAETALMESLKPYAELYAKLGGVI